VLDEIAKIANEIGEGAVSLVLTPEEFKHCWQLIDERTASSSQRSILVTTNLLHK
jgi:hypothetical protein